MCEKFPRVHLVLQMKIPGSRGDSSTVGWTLGQEVGTEEVSSVLGGQEAHVDFGMGSGPPVSLALTCQSQPFHVKPVSKLILHLG